LCVCGVCGMAQTPVDMVTHGAVTVGECLG